MGWPGSCTRLPVVIRAEHVVQAEQQQHNDARGLAEPHHLVQGAVSVHAHVWPPEAGLPEPILPRPWWKPGVVGVLRVLPLQRPPLGVERGV